MMDSQPCKYLRTKRLFIPSVAVDAFTHTNEYGAVCQCWCNKTMTEIGLDQRHVAYEYCTDPKRRCYKAR